MVTRDKRKHELFRLPLEILLNEYQQIKGIPEGTQPEIDVSELIETILDAEFPSQT